MTGNDDIFADDLLIDDIRCGPGFDEVVADSIDTVAQDCEAVTTV